MIDLHSHILPGVDDGARTIDDSRELALQAAAEGITAIAATPHVRADFPTTAEAMEWLVDILRRDFAASRIPVEVLAGGELDLRMVSALEPEEVRRFTLAQTGRYLLVEFPYRGWPVELEQMVFDLQVSGLIPILAHPERNRQVQKNPGRLTEAVELGALVQVTAASLDGRIGRSSRQAAEQLLGLGLAHLLASDAHTSDVREIGLRAAAEAVGDESLARWLTEEVPRAIVAGEEIPPRPAGLRRRKRFLLF